MQQAKPKSKRKPAKRKVKTRNPTINQLVEGVGVSDTTLKKYFARGCPRTSIEAVQKWRSENIKAAAQDADISEIGIELKRAEMAERWENARARQLKNDEKERLLVSRLAVSQMHGRVISRLVNRLNALGLKCANLCPSELKAPIKEAVEDTVNIAIREFINEFSVDRIR